MNLKKFSAIASYFLGADTITAFTSYLVLSWMLDIGLNLNYLVFSFFFAYFPDIDIILYLLLKHYRMTHLLGEDYWSHWKIFHNVLIIPVMIIALCAIVSWFHPREVVFLALLASVNIMSHIVHDATQSHGVKMLWPVSSTRITFTDAFPREAYFEDVLAREDTLSQPSNIREDVRARLCSISWLQVGVICVEVCIFAFWKWIS